MIMHYHIHSCYPLGNSINNALSQQTPFPLYIRQLHRIVIPTLKVYLHIIHAIKYNIYQQTRVNALLEETSSFLATPDSMIKPFRQCIIPSCLQMSQESNSRKKICTVILPRTNVRGVSVLCKNIY